ncbi:hypothetical protein BCR42DRAFT_443232 [Absidia repens]|uniref:Uncharacterized protein n=1 Tax=Absidia repens TaxID=90262 RepID=A0A1X2I0B2_9FUNG|nr:hypothetical protein BCR42DRAFT_443232 [Absidia repens]
MSTWWFLDQEAPPIVSCAMADWCVDIDCLFDQILQCHRASYTSKEPIPKYTNGILDYRYGEIDTLDARFALIVLTKKSISTERNVVLALEASLPTMKDLDLERASEIHLTASYIHPLIERLLAITSPDKVAHCLNDMMAWLIGVLVI